MCGIVGYIGQGIKAEKLVQILKKLEYRGYDSSGLAGIGIDGFKIIKKPGQIINLEKHLPKDWQIEVGIAHTRWATHGEPNEQNAHPHISSDNNWVVVHNGIIENAKYIKESQGIKTKGETDTEVFTEFLAKNNPNCIEEFVKVFDQVRGSYAIICQNTYQKKLYLAKKSSPLYVAEDENHNFWIASDTICFSGLASTCFVLKDGIFAEIEGEKICFYDKNGLRKNIEKINIENCQQICDETAVESYMLKEILEQPIALKRQINTYKKTQMLKPFDKKFIKRFNRVMLVACGSAYHAGLVGAKYFEEILNISAEAVVASEFVYNKRVFDDKTLFILISQSGETADTINALKAIKQKGGYTIAITNVQHSTLAQNANFMLDICAGQEIAVASTKAYVCMLSMLYLLVMHIKGQTKLAFRDIEEVSEKLLDFDFDRLDKLAEEIKTEKMLIMLGKNFDYVTALESALKLKEIAYIYTMALPAGELKHGYLALVEKGTKVFSFACQESLLQKNINAGLESKARGAEVKLVSPWAKKEEVKVFRVNHLLMPIISIVPMQYLAYKVSVLKNLSPDKPRNLAKSVTVE